MIVHKNVLNSFLVNNCRLGRVDTSPPSLIFNNNNMALQVWLPLTTDLHNQGLLNDVTVSNRYCTYESDGKIGGCYHAGVDQDLILNKRTSDLFSDNHSFTIAIWVKFISEPITHSGIFASMKYQSEVTAGGFGLVTRVANKIQLMIAGTDFSEIDPVGSFITPEIRKWIHIAATYDNSTSTYSLYLNGSLIKSNIYTAHTYKANNQEFVLGGCPQGGWGSKNDVCLNDARLYDHCLSPKEVKEISKGLVLHYPLNSLVNPNLVKNSYFCTNMNTGTVEVVPNVGYVDNTAYYGSPAYHVFREGQTTIAYSEFQFIFRANKCVPGKQYCISFWVKKCHSGGNWGNIILDGLRWFKTGDNTMYTTSITWKNRPSESLLNVWQYASFYFTFPVECTAYAYYYNTVGKDIDYYISKIKVEEGTVSTPWCDYGITNNIVYDCSGYQNNGTISGSLSCSADSPRYKISTISIDESSFSKILCSNLNLPNGQTTLSFWSKPTNKNEKDNSKIEITYSKNKYFT